MIFYSWLLFCFIHNFCLLIFYLAMLLNSLVLVVCQLILFVDEYII